MYEEEQCFIHITLGDFYWLLLEKDSMVNGLGFANIRLNKLKDVSLL